MRMPTDLSLIYDALASTIHRMIRTILNTFRLRSAPGPSGTVHFHQGPQGQPTPCFDERCSNPRLTV
jgi:hypothetical protein